MNDKESKVKTKVETESDKSEQVLLAEALSIYEAQLDLDYIDED